MPRSRRQDKLHNPKNAPHKEKDRHVNGPGHKAKGPDRDGCNSINRYQGPNRRWCKISYPNS